MVVDSVAFMCVLLDFAMHWVRLSAAIGRCIVCDDASTCSRLCEQLHTPPGPVVSRVATAAPFDCPGMRWLQLAHWLRCLLLLHGVGAMPGLGQLVGLLVACAACMWLEPAGLYAYVRFSSCRLDRLQASKHPVGRCHSYGLSLCSHEPLAG